MKLLITIFLLAAVPVIASCNDTTKENASGGERKQDEQPVQKQYICPMKCTSPSASPGKCPKCGMTLEEVNPA